MSNSDNALRAPDTFAGMVNRALAESLGNKDVLLCGQLIKYGFAGCTTGLYEKHPEQFITYPVAESLMNSSAIGLALAGKIPVVFHVRMDFLLCGMDALFNQLPPLVKKGYKLPCTFVVQVGKGNGQGAQHSKDLTAWFQRFEGWTVRVPQTPLQAYEMLKESIFGDRPVLFVLHRQLFDSNEGKEIIAPDYIKLCGASQRHEREFYGTDNANH